MRDLPEGQRLDLLKVLTSPSDVRADVIRQLHERSMDAWVEMLVELEADPVLRAEAVVSLRQGELLD